jgi:hypothetical protein
MRINDSVEIDVLTFCSLCNNTTRSRVGSKTVIVVPTPTGSA